MGVWPARRTAAGKTEGVILGYLLPPSLLVPTLGALTGVGPIAEAYGVITRDSPTHATPVMSRSSPT